MRSSTEASPDGFDGSTLYIKAPQRSSVSDTAEVAGLVSEILKSVRERGDEAIYERRSKNRPRSAA